MGNRNSSEKRSRNCWNGFSVPVTAWNLVGTVSQFQYQLITVPNGSNFHPLPIMELKKNRSRSMFRPMLVLKNSSSFSINRSGRYDFPWLVRPTIESFRIVPMCCVRSQSSDGTWKSGWKHSLVLHLWRIPIFNLV